MQSRRLRAAVPALSLFVLLLLGVVPLPVSTVASVEAQRCTPPAFWNPFGGGRCEVYMCAEGWTLDNNYCRKDGEYPVFAASCPVGWGVRAVDHGISGYSMRCVDPSPPAPPPPPLSLPSIPDFRVPSGGSVSTLFPAATGGTAPYAYSLSGLPPGISFAPSTRRATGTLPTVGVDTTYTITYSVTDNAGGTASVSCLTTVRAAAAPATPDPPPSTDGGSIVKTGVNVSSSRTYSIKLTDSVEVSVKLTGMTTDFDCTVAGDNCTNLGGTADDSWSGTLGAGEHKIVVYPVGGGSGNYTLTVSARKANTGGRTGTRTQVTTLVDTSETRVSSSRTYSFTLERSAEVDVALTGLTIDFDCRVGSSRCTNRWGTQDDSWSGELAAGSHSVVVYPYDPGPGNYSLTVTATETLAFVAQPLAGGPILIGRICDADENGNPIEETCKDVYADVTNVTGEDPGAPPGARPGEGDPGPEDDGDDDGGTGGGGPTTPTSGVIGSLKNVVEATKLDCRGMNFALRDRLGSTHGGGSTTRPEHGGIDMQTMGRHSNFYAPVGGTLRYLDQDGGCGHHARITRADGTWVTICHLDPAHDVDPGPVAAGALIGRDGYETSGAGNSDGPHLHLIYRNASTVLNPFDLWGGQSAMENEGFTFNDSDPPSCEESE